jgi:hypothetical protein
MMLLGKGNLKDQRTMGIVHQEQKEEEKQRRLRANWRRTKMLLKKKLLHRNNFM